MMLNIHKSWNNIFEIEFHKSYFTALKSILVEEQKKYEIYPTNNKIFEAFNHTELSEVKVVILGQDPYHGSSQANGLSFSVNDHIKPPPSLINIYKEIENELHIKMNMSNGNLTPWAKQGVLLLNSILTVRANEPASHRNIGWETFTDALIKHIAFQNRPIVFMLWGNYAKSKSVLITNKMHLVLTSAHPSPFSFYNGFLGNNHFVLANKFLSEKKLKPIDWKI
jgi:uracil-DNA glycosylase